VTPAQITRYQRKARVVADAWTALFGAPPSARAVIRAMCVAEFETHLGDARRSWEGEHNWGAIHKRSLTAAERETLDARGISAEGGEDALTAARALLPPTAKDEALHIDSAPSRGHYFVWFWAFPSDAAAARKFLQILVAQRPAVRAALEKSDIADTARAMYETHYYDGLFTDPEANIRAYAARLAELEPTITAALVAPASPIVPAVAPSPSVPAAFVPPVAPSPLPRPAGRGAPLRVGSRSSSPALVLLVSTVLVLASSMLTQAGHR